MEKKFISSILSGTLDKMLNEINRRLDALECPTDVTPKFRFETVENTQSPPAPDDLAELIAKHHMIHIQADAGAYFILNMNDAHRLAAAIREKFWCEPKVYGIPHMNAFHVNKIARLERELAEANRKLDRTVVEVSCPNCLTVFKYGTSKKYSVWIEKRE
jgi:hypothetical protein